MFELTNNNTRGAHSTCQQHHFVAKSTKGFTLIELMIVLALIAILLSLALPVYSNYSIRAKIAEGLGVAAGAKTAVTTACQEDPTIAVLTNHLAGYSPTPTMNTNYVSTIEISSDCTTPIITITTRDTGTDGFDPVITLTGDITVGSGRATWMCASSNTPAHLLPLTCRS